MRLLGIAEVEAVGHAERLGPDAGEVGGAFEQPFDGAGVGVAGDPVSVAVDRDRDGAVGLRDVEHRGIGGTGPVDGA